MTYVSRNFYLDRETNALGEDYQELLKIERAYRLLEKRCERLLTKLDSRRALSSVMDLGLLLADARHDASFASTLSLAKDAYAEAKVVRLPVSPKLRVAV